jgi:mannose-1-phosphate guanylyltransferase/mannose-6-phosphate isomerase
MVISRSSRKGIPLMPSDRSQLSIQPVVLCGGSGTRLWPLSRKSFPKQFVPLIGNSSLLELTLKRVCQFSTDPLIVASEDHRFMVTDIMEAAQVSGKIILEPVARNTAAAMATAAIHANETGQELLLFCPADHHIPDQSAFGRAVNQGISAAQNGAIVTFGIRPNLPSTAYGYIKYGMEREDHAYQAAQFIEKPPLNRAQELLLEGNALWNAGIFLCKASTLVAALERHAPDILDNCREALSVSSREKLGDNLEFVRPAERVFSTCRSQSIDYAVMEVHNDVAVVPFDGQWSDVGSWNTVADLYEADADENRIHGNGFTHKATRTFIHSPHRPVVALGTKNLLIIDTPDAVLVADSTHAEAVKEVVSLLEEAQIVQAHTHSRVGRPWGWYDSIDIGERFQVKRIGVKPGASLSLQKHYHRAEHWVVVKGTAEVTCGERVFLLGENQSTYIPVGEVHRLRNPGKVELELIEIQSGSYLGEDDIVRLEDFYGRVKK